MSRDEVFQYGKTFTEVRSNWAFNNVTGWLGHQTTHTRKLLNLLLITTSTGINHEEQRIYELVAFVVLKFTVEGVRDVIRSVCPNINHLLVTLVVSDDTVTILLSNFFNFSVSLNKFWLLLFRHHHVDDTNRNTGTGSFFETKALKIIKNNHGAGLTSTLVAAPDDVTDLLLTNVEVDET